MFINTTTTYYLCFRNRKAMNAATLISWNAVSSKKQNTLLENYIYHSGFPCTLACLSSWLPGKWNFHPCPFLTSGPLRTILYRRHRLSMRALPDFQFCRCPEILMLGDKANVSVSIFSQ